MTAAAARSTLNVFVSLVDHRGINELSRLEGNRFYATEPSYKRLPEGITLGDSTIISYPNPDPAVFAPHILVVNLFDPQKPFVEPENEKIPTNMIAMITRICMAEKGPFVLVDPADYEPTLAEFLSKGQLDPITRIRIGERGLEHVARYHSKLAAIVGERPFNVMP